MRSSPVLRARDLHAPVLATLGLLLASPLVQAASRTFTYNGTLEKDGAAYTGTADFQFVVTDNASCSFTEKFDTVQVYAGKFGVSIGSKTTGGLPACVFNATAMYLKVSVRRGGSTAGYAALTGSQRIRPVPFSYLASESSDMQVDGTLSTTSWATTGGTLTVKGTSGKVQIEGSDLLLGTKDGRTGADGAQYALSHLATDQLQLNWGGGFTGGIVLAGRDVDIDKKLTVGGDLVVKGTLTAANTPALAGDGSATTGSRSDHNHTISCPGSPVATLTSGNAKTRICLYKYSQGSNWQTAADNCWNNYGAQLCSLNQVYLACSTNALTLESQLWLGDRTDDDNALATNGTSCSDMDGQYAPLTTIFVGGYCCIEEHQY